MKLGHTSIPSDANAPADSSWAQIGSIPPEDREHVESIRAWVADHTGLYFGPRKHFSLYKRLQSLCWRQKIPGLAELERQLHGPEGERFASLVASAVSTHHTFFFRESQVLEQFRLAILPRLPIDDSWHIWSAAASSGEEAYSVAILIAEMLGLEPARRQAAILGTDISHSVIEQAERGVYAGQRMDLVSEEYRTRYFEPAGAGRWRVCQPLRQMCTFRRMNLSSAEWPFRNPFHVILCRNLLYYFDAPIQEQLVERMYDVATPGGWLITSVTETLYGLNTRWRRVETGIFQKV